MTARSDRFYLAEEFIRAFCEGDLEGVGRLLTEDFRFRGPYLSSDSRADYLEALAADPPNSEGRYELRSRFTEGDRVCLVYRYTKPGASILVAQWCAFRGGRIRSMRLDFEPAEDSGSGA